MGSEGSVSGGGGGAYKLVRSRSLNFLPISERALSTCCCSPEERGAGQRLFRSQGVTLQHLQPHPQCDRSGTPVCKAGWRCRSLHQSSASSSSRISPAFRSDAPQSAGSGSRQVRTLFCSADCIVRHSTHIWHLDLPDDKSGARGDGTARLTLSSPHGEATVHRVHAVHIRT